MSTGFWNDSAIARAPGIQEKLKLGFVGVGNYGVNNLAALVDEEIAAICDVDEVYLGEMGEQFPKAQRFADWRKMLNEAKLDGLVISTPDHQHCGIALAAMKRELHVYCEKPLMHTVNEGIWLAGSASSNRKLVTQLGVQHHASAGYRQVKELIRSGGIGKVSEVHCWTARPIWPQGELKRSTERPAIPKSLNWDLWLGPAPERPYHPDYAPIRWRGWWDFGTGSLGDMGPHLFDPVVDALQLGSPTSIEAEFAPVSSESPPAWCIVRWQLPVVGDPKAKVNLFYYDGGKRPPPEVTQGARLPPDGILFLGSKARLFAPQRGERPTVFPLDPKESIPVPKVPEENWPTHHRNWSDSCRLGKQAWMPFARGVRLCEIPLLGNVAIRSGKKLSWGEPVRMTTGEAEADRFLERQYRKDWKAT